MFNICVSDILSVTVAKLQSPAGQVRHCRSHSMKCNVYQMTTTRFGYLIVPFSVSLLLDLMKQYFMVVSFYLHCVPCRELGSLFYQKQQHQAKAMQFLKQIVILSTRWAN